MTDPPAGLPRATAIVLAGGRSSRFGRDKLAADLEGQPLLHHAVRAVAAVASEVIVVLGADQGAPDLPAGLPDLRVVRDSAADLGPLAGVATGLAEAREPLSLVVAGDQPRLRDALLRGLLEVAAGVAATEDGAVAPAAIVLADEGTWRTLPCIVATEPGTILAKARLRGDERSVHAFLDALGVAVVPEATWRAWDPEGAWRRDVDRPDDLARA